MKKCFLLIGILFISVCSSMDPNFALYNETQNEVEVYVDTSDNYEELKQNAFNKFQGYKIKISLPVPGKDLNEYLEPDKKYIIFGIVYQISNVSYAIFEKKTEKFPPFSCGGSYPVRIYFNTNRIYIKQNDPGDSAPNLLVEIYP